MKMTISINFRAPLIVAHLVYEEIKGNKSFSRTNGTRKIKRRKRFSDDVCAKFKEYNQRDKDRYLSASLKTIKILNLDGTVSLQFVYSSVEI